MEVNVGCLFIYNKYNNTSEPQSAQTKHNKHSFRRLCLLFRKVIVLDNYGM